MKKFLLGFIALISTASIYAQGPLTIINNTNLTIDLEYNYCNNSSFCTLVSKSKLDAISTHHNSLRYLYPVGMDTFSINTATAYDTSNNVQAKLSGSCSATTSSHLIVIDNYGTSQLYCMYS